MVGTQDANESRFVTPRVAARLLGVTPAHLAFVRGLRFQRTAGGHRRYERASVLELVEARRNRAVVRAALAEQRFEAAQAMTF